MSEPLGYTCPCGRWHEAGGWAAAHWFETLTHTCDACGAQNTIRDGQVRRSTTKKPRRTKSLDNPR